MNGGSNDCSYADPDSESAKRGDKSGHFYAGNITTSARDRVTSEGSKGLARDQGMIRSSALAESDKGGAKGQTKKIGRAGSHAHLGKM